MESSSVKKCPKCGEENKSSAFYCNNCGYDFIEEKPINNKKSSKGKVAGIILGIICGLVVFGGIALYFVGNEYIEKVNKENFYHNCVMAEITMAQGGAIAEECCNEICMVWHNSIWKENDDFTNTYTKDDNGYFFDDFNDALYKYTDSVVYEEHITKLNDNFDEVKNYLAEARKIETPDEYADMYVEILELFDMYVEFTELPMSMTGSYNSFSDKFDSIDNEFFIKYRKISGIYNK